MLKCIAQAALAQLVEQLIRNEQVAGSSPVRGSPKERFMPLFFCFVMGPSLRLVECRYLGRLVCTPFSSSSFIRLLTSGAFGSFIAQR